MRNAVAYVALILAAPPLLWCLAFAALLGYKTYTDGWTAYEAIERPYWMRVGVAFIAGLLLLTLGLALRLGQERRRG